MFQSYIFNDSHSIFFFSSLSLNFARHIYCFLAFSKPETTFQKQEGNSQHLTGAHIIKELLGNHDDLGAVVHVQTLAVGK